MDVRGPRKAHSMGEIIKRMKGERFIGWYLRWVDSDGRRKQRASGQPTYAEAKRMLVEIEARVARGKLGVPERDETTTMTVAELSERYLREYDSPRIRDLPRWVAKQRLILRPVIDAVGAQPAVSFDANQAERLRNRLMRRYAANSTRTQLTSIASVFAWATKNRLLSHNPFVDVKKPKKESRVEFLSSQDARKLLDAADLRAKRDQRGVVLSIATRLGLFGGLRAGEIFGLRWRDCDLARGILTVRKSYGDDTKSGKPRTVPMPDELLDALNRWQPICPPTAEGVVCPLSHDKNAGGGWHKTSRRRPEITNLYRAAGLPVPAAPWHCLRHSYASLFVQSGGSIVTLQKLLGHSDIKTTMIYAHLDDGFVTAEVKKLRI